jgi:hypothetical protein
MRPGAFPVGGSLILKCWDNNTMNTEETLELYKLVIANDEVEYEAEGSITTYVVGRAAEYANRLGRKKFQIKESDYYVDDYTGDHHLLFYCERNYI